MATDFFLKVGDTLPSIQATLQDANGDAVDITGSSVTFIMTNKSTGVTAVEAVATIVTPGGGVVRYDWQDGDTDIAGPYKAEWEVEFAPNQVETFPNNAYLNIKITSDLGGVEPD